MGDYWPLLLAGAAMWAVLIVCAVLQLRRPHHTPGACPKCDHTAGLVDGHCVEVTDNNGWSSSRCDCDDTYHRRYEHIAN